jgi:glycine betaine/proline transport system substrate-binding protein
LLRRFELPIADIEPMLKNVDVDKQKVEVVAQRWVAAHPDLVDGWLRA